MTKEIRKKGDCCTDLNSRVLQHLEGFQIWQSTNNLLHCLTQVRQPSELHISLYLCLLSLSSSVPKE